MDKKQHSNTPSPQHSTRVVVGIITISDRASTGEYDDLGGPAVKKFAAAGKAVGMTVTKMRRATGSGQLASSFNLLLPDAMATGILRVPVTALVAGLVVWYVKRAAILLPSPSPQLVAVVPDVLMTVANAVA